MEIDDTLNTREQSYGDYAQQSRLSQSLKQYIHASLPPYGGRAPAYVNEALDMICTKLARICNGDPSHIDRWHDIAGYARLVEIRLIADTPTNTDGE